MLEGAKFKVLERGKGAIGASRHSCFVNLSEGTSGLLYDSWFDMWFDKCQTTVKQLSDFLQAAWHGPLGCYRRQADPFSVLNDRVVQVG